MPCIIIWRRHMAVHALHNILAAPNYLRSIDRHLGRATSISLPLSTSPKWRGELRPALRPEVGRHIPSLDPDRGSTDHFESWPFSPSYSTGCSFAAFSVWWRRLVGSVRDAAYHKTLQSPSKTDPDRHTWRESARQRWQGASMTRYVKSTVGWVLFYQG